MKKRIVECEKCQAKLSIFDTGKPMKQKCPKCGETIEINAEKGNKDPAPDKKVEDTPKLTDDKKTDDTSKQVDNKKAEDNKKSDSGIYQEKPADKKDDKKAEDSDKPVEPLPAGNTSGGMFKPIVIGTLVLIIILVLISKTRTDKYYKDLATRLIRIEENIAKIK